MAIAVDSTSFTFVTNVPSSATWSHTCAGSDRALHVALSIDVNSVSQTFTGATYAGVEMTLLLSGHNAGTGRPIYLWRLVAPATGTNDIVISWSGSLPSHGIFVATSFTGVDQTTPESVAALAIALGNSNSPASSSLTGPTGDLILGVLSYNNAATADITEGADQTKQVDYAGDGSSRTLVRMSTKAGSGSSTTMSWTNSPTANHWGATALAIKAAAGGGSSVPKIMQQH